MDIHSKTKDELILLIDELNLKIASQEQAIQGKPESSQETQLRNDSLTRLTALLNAIPDLMFVFDSECRFIDYHSENQESLYLNPKKFLGKKPEEVLPQAIGHMVSSKIKAILSSGKPDNFTYDLKIKGDTHHFESRGVLYGNNRVLFIVRDITEQKQAEADLEESREKYRGLSEAAFEAIFLSEKGVCIEQNHTAEKIFGYSTEEAIGRYGTEWIIPEDRDMVMKNMLAGYEEPYEATALKKDGSTFPCVLKGKMMTYKGKRVRVTSLSDHTARKKAEEELKIKDWAIESSISAIAISDLSGNLKYANPAFLKLWGYSSLKEAVGESPYSFWQDDKKADETLKSLITEGSWSGEMTAINQQGDSFEVQVEASVVKDKQGRPHSMLASFADITERKKFISSLQEAKEKAEAGNRLKAAFINNISHEIRTPLNGILGFGNLITQPDIGEAEKEQFYSQVKTSSGRLLRTITNYMDISMLASGNFDLRRKPVALYHMLQQLFKKFQPLCTEKNLALNLWNIAENNSVSVWTDEDLLKTILTHVLDNAVTFTKHGEITFGFDLRPGEVEFFIRDTGVGISVGMQSLIFESFVQASTSNNSGYDGSGLGLSIALGMAKLLHGGIRVKSEPGHGSEFFVSIPDTGLKKENIAPDASENPVPVIKDPVILIAEDDSTNRLLIKVMLKQSGIKVIEAENGQEAVALCREHPEICLAVMDLKMPVLDGFDATRQIKSFRQDLPVIAVTAYGLSGDEKRAIEAGCSDYLAKPYHKEVLLSKLRRYGII